MAADASNHPQDEVLDRDGGPADPESARPDQTAADVAEGRGDDALEPDDEATAAAQEESEGAEEADDTADDAGPAAEEPRVRFDAANPFAVPEDLIPIIAADGGRRRRRSRDEDAEPLEAEDVDRDGPDEEDEDRPAVSRRRRRRRRGSVDMELAGGEDGDPEGTVTRVRAPRQAMSTGPEAVQGVKGSTRLEAKRQRRRDSRSGGRRRTVITEAEFLARRESVDRKMLVRQRDHRIQIAVLEDGVLAEHFVSNTTQDSMIGNVYVGKVQNVLPSMEAAFVDIGRGRNAVLYAGEVDWDAAHLEGKAKKIENALKSGDTVLVQVTKDPVGHKGARLTSQISLPGRYLVYVPGGTMTGISRKLPDVERTRLKKILKDHLPQDAGVIVRTAAEGTSEQELQNDINRLRAQWEGIQEKAASTKTLAPELLYAEPDLTIKTVRDVFNEDFSAMLVQGEATWDNIEAYVTYVAPHLLDRLHHWVPEDHDGEDLYATHRVDEQLHKALERKVYLPSGGSLVIDRTEAMTVVDVNTGKFTGSGGNLEETVTKNNLEAAEEIVRQLRLRDIGGIIVIDFIDMVLESNRDLVLRRLVECLGRDRTKHQVAEVTSLGLVQMTRKRMGTGLVEVFSEVCEACGGRGILIQDTPVERSKWGAEHRGEVEGKRRHKRRRGEEAPAGAGESAEVETAEEERQRLERAAAARAALMSIAKASGKAADEVSAARSEAPEPASDVASAAEEDAPVSEAAEHADDERPAGESGGRRRKRRGRRRGRGRAAEDRGGEDAAERAPEERDGQDDLSAREPESAVDSMRDVEDVADAPLAEGAESVGAVPVVEGVAPAPSGAPADLDDPVAERAAEAAEPVEAVPAAERSGRTRRGRSRSRRAESPQGAGTQAAAVTAPSRAGEEPEAASPSTPQPVASPSEPVSRREAATTPVPEEDGVITVGGEPVSVPRRRRSRRATSDGVGAPRAMGLDDLEAAVGRRAARPLGDAPAADVPVPAAAPAAPDAATEPVVEPAVPAAPADSAIPAAPAAPAAPRRRSRRAVSSDGASVQVQEGAAARGARVTAQAAERTPAAPAATSAPVMLGVGVKAEDIVRGE